MISFRWKSCKGASVLAALLLWWSACDAFAAQLELTWLAGSTDHLGFSVERSEGSLGTFAEIAATDAGATNYVDSTVADGAAYCYRVRAFNQTAFSDYSNVACKTTVQTASLAVLKAGTGSGAVISEPSGIICGSSCSASYPSGTTVTVTATPATGSTFAGWSGGSCGESGSCSLTVTDPTTVTATFSLSSVGLTVTRTGTGTVTSSPEGISCGTDCSTSYPYGTSVTLSALAPAGSTFSGWGGACSGTGSCTMTLTSGATVSAAFATQASTLTVSTSGKGTVTSTPAGINCGKTCSATMPGGTLVTLTATPGSDFAFTGWSGAGCVGTGSCTLALNGSLALTATFRKESRR